MNMFGALPRGLSAPVRQGMVLTRFSRLLARTMKLGLSRVSEWI